MTAFYDTAKNYSRILQWDEENRLIKTVDTTSGNSVTTTYQYDTKGMRIIKDGPYGKTIYVDTGYVETNEAMVSNHVFMGNTRIASIVKHKGESQPATYYFATDHLGSSSVLTNNDGSYHERLEYLPYGEVWVEDQATSGGYTTPYKFTGKELDKETNLYYFGARYYDARISRWISTDPALDKFLPTGDKENDKKLPARGVYEQSNIDLFGYVGNNPVIYIDPDGNFRFGKRPLSNSKTLQITLTALMLMFAPRDVNIKTIDKMNMEVVHEQGFYDDDTGKNIGYGQEGYMDKENKKDYAMEDIVYDDVLMKNAEENVKKSGKFDAEDYSLLGIDGKTKNNCQDFADALRNEYNNLYNKLDERGKKEVDARVEQLRQKIQQEEKKK